MAIINVSDDTLKALEGAIDESSLASVIEALSVIAYEKAEHIRSTWQDQQTARMWTRNARRLENWAGMVTV